MAKTPFSKLSLKKKNETKILTYNEQEIEVKQYLSTDEKIDIITNVLQLSADDNNFANPIKVEVYFSLELMYHYTNLSFTDKQKENPSKLYDLLEENEVIAAVVDLIPQNEYKLLFNWTQETIDAFYKYRNSVMGILDQVSADYSNLELDAQKIQSEIANPENLGLLKDVMEKLG